MTARHASAFVADPEERSRDAVACYVYAVVPAGTRVPEELRDGPAVSLLRHEDLAAAVSDVRTDRVLGTREDLLTHERVVESLAAETTVVPLRFGAVVTTAGAVVEEFLAPYHEWFADVIDELRDRQEFTVTGDYVRDVVLREVLSEEPEVIRLRESLRDMPEDAGYYERIRLGELVAQAVDRKREADSETLVQALASHAVAVAPRRPGGEDGAVDVAVLVNAARRRRFDEAVEELGARWAGRIRLRVTGPLAPYDFVPAPQEEVLDMGLVTGLLTLPLAPVRSVVWLGERIRDQVVAECYDPAVIRGQLAEVDEARATGEISEDEAAELEDDLVSRLTEPRM